MPHIIVGTAGHIDHGKTALVKALTGIDADRLKEEKQRGITIDIGFANLTLDAHTTIGFIDVPGHERFIKNMLAGTGGIDMVILVIAADESVMPQTREHLEICSLLHVKQGLTVLTKIDRVEQETANAAELEVREFLKGSFLERAPILRVSSLTGEGMPQLIETLRELSNKVEPKDATQIFRIPIDRCFTMKGFGTVVTGTLIAGRIRREDEVEIFPSQRTTRVRGIQVHGQAASEASAGQRTALNLQGVEVADIERGMVLTIPGVFKPASMFDCHLELLPSAPGPIEMRKRVRFHVGTAEVMGHVVLLGCDRLKPAESGFVQIRLEQPAFALPGDRFIIRQYSPMITIGGGGILDAMPEKHRRSDKGVIEKLQTLKEGSAGDRLMAIIEEAGDPTIQKLVARSGVDPARVREQAAALAGANRIHVLGNAVVATTTLQRASDRVLFEVQEFHCANPLVKGSGREELRGRCGEMSSLLFQAALEKLAAEKRIAVTADVIHEYGRTVTLKADEEQMRNRLTERFRTLGLHVPAPDEMIDDLELDRVSARKIIQLMLKENALIRITGDMVVDSAAVFKLISDVKTLKFKNPKLGVGEFKDLTGVSRKYAIPLLEYLDRQRVTRRVGAERVIL